MKSYEKKALLKFTSIYFVSTAIFVIVFGFLYYNQEKTQILQQTTMKMHEYVMALKQSRFNYKQDGYSFKIVKDDRFKYKLAVKDQKYYKKSFPAFRGESYVLVEVDAQIVDAELNDLKNFTIILQIAFLLFFLFTSYSLAKLSLKPMNDTISHLDRFLKDLIHDLNTPTTTIKLNTNMIKKITDDINILKKITRIEKSVDDISGLYDNLEVLISKKLDKKDVDLYNILKEHLETYSFVYPNIEIDIEPSNMVVKTNEKAIIRIIDNILSNSFKYSKDDGKINISFKNNKLIIQDNGKGMIYPQKIFERSYSENENGHGIGMHIVQRLCDDLNIDISINSQQNVGTTVVLSF